MREIYSVRRVRLLDGLQQHFGRWLEPLPSAAGLHLAALTKPEVDVEDLVSRARHHEVGVYSLRSYHAGKPRQSGLVFGYGAIEERALTEGLSRLRSAWKK